jgi:transposase
MKMKQKSQTRQTGAAKAIKDVRRATRKQYSAEEKIRIVLDGLRGEETGREADDIDKILVVAYELLIAIKGSKPLDHFLMHGFLKLRLLRRFRRKFRGCFIIRGHHFTHTDKALQRGGL